MSVRHASIKIAFSRDHYGLFADLRFEIDPEPLTEYNSSGLHDGGTVMCGWWLY